MSFIDRHPRLAAFYAAAAIIVVIAGISIAGFIGSWVDKGAEVVGPDNVSNQYTQVIELFNSTQAGAANACTAVQASKQSGDPLLIESPAVAYGAVVRSQIVEYNRRMANPFEAKYVVGAGYPKAIPTTPEIAAGDWCVVAAQIASLKR